MRSLVSRPRLISLFISVVLFTVTACNLTTGPSNQQQTIAPSQPASGRPQVTIISPANNSEIVVGSQVLVSVNATDSVGITRITLSANGTIVKTISSEAPTGDRNMNAVLDYTPTTAGSIPLQVIAYRANVASDPAQITINARTQQAQVTATIAVSPNLPIINPNDPTCRVLTNVGLNLRQGPGTNYPIITTVGAGVQAPVIGRTGSNDWWQVRVGVNIGWFSGQFVTLLGTLCAGIPIVPTPPPPTSAVTATTPPTSTLTLTPVPPTATPTPGPADLVISNITGPTTLMLGPGNSPVSSSFTVQITNTGQGSTGQFSNTISVSPPGTESPLGVVANLNPGESIVLNVSLTFNSAGTYNVQARVDSGNQVTEVSEVNNVGIFTVTVSPFSLSPLPLTLIPPFSTINFDLILPPTP